MQKIDKNAIKILAWFMLFYECVSGKRLGENSSFPEHRREATKYKTRRKE
jgi:hypothetical protein